MTGQQPFIATPANAGQGTLADEFGTITPAAAPTGPRPGDFVHYRGSLTAFLGQIMQVKYANSARLILDAGVWGTLRNVRYESVVKCGPHCRRCGS
jgi:hypothetical protein